MIFTVRRKINGIAYLTDEDRLFASGWFTAYIKLLLGRMMGRFDSSCYIDGVLIEEGELTDDEMLDLIINERKNK